VFLTMLQTLAAIDPATGSASATAVAPLIGWIVVIAACCYAVTIDVRVRRIPNALTFPLWGAGIAWWLITGGFAGLGEAFGGMAIAGLPFFVLWMIGGGGAGDAKMMFAIGTWLGIDNGFIAAVSVGVAGGILSLAYAVGHGRLLISLLNTAWMTLTLPLVLLGPGRLQERQKLCPPSGDRPLKTPYSVAMLAGTCAAAMWVWTWAH
jgi:Flp pilus assembly protein protease CpaA